MTQPMVKVAKLNNNRYEISVESEHEISARIGGEPIAPGVSR